MSDNICYITRRGGGDGILIEAPYSANFNDKMKTSIPSPERRWIPDEKCWWVSESYADRAIEIAEDCFNVVEC